MKRARMIRWLAGAALAAGLLLVPAHGFSDTEGHWASASIDKWSQEYGILGGYDDGTFRPDNSITRGAFAGIMDRFLHFQTTAPEGTFADLRGNYWKDAILKLNGAGVYLGNNGYALPGSSITRQQAVTMIARAFQITGESEALPYADAGHIESYAVGAVAEMTARGWITDVTDGLFRPTEPITRAEIVNIFGNMIQTLIQEPATRRENVAGTLMISSGGEVVLEDMVITGDLILAPGVTGSVTLRDVTLEGELRNLSAIQPAVLTTDPEETPTRPVDPENPETPVTPGIQPSEIYTPSAMTGGMIEYGERQIPIREGRERSRLYEGDFTWNGDRLEYIGSDFSTRFGIDVSAHQNRNCPDKIIDWQAVRNDGVDFVMVRAGFRGTSTGTLNADEFYAQNIDGAMAAGLETGVYFFAQAITVEEALEEADYLIGLLRGHEINGPVAYDWEMHDSTYRVYGTEPEMATACAIAFCQRVKEAGYTPMIYGGTYVSYVKYDQGAIAPYLSWYPEYKRETSEKLYPTFYYQMDYWQFSDQCSIAGITGRVDGNLQFISK